MTYLNAIAWMRQALAVADDAPFLCKTKAAQMVHRQVFTAIADRWHATAVGLASR